MTNSDSSKPDAPAVRAALDACASAAAGITLSLFRTPLAVDNKFAEGFDPVTQADRDAELAIRDSLAARFPEHGVVGEEWDSKPTRTPYTWIIDPIDGTRAFISGVPVWGTLVGLTVEGRAVAGMMAQPYLDERWIAVDGQTTFRRGDVEHPVRTSAVTALAQARLTTTSPEMFTGPYQAGWHAVRDAALQTRYGLDCYGYCLLASGHVDLVVEVGLKDVDIAPLIPIIEGAGGVVTTWDGGRAEQGGTCLAAATPQLHWEALSALRRALLD